MLAFAEQHGLPIIIKAAFGGGGRGMKIAWRMDEVADLYESAVREAVTAFGRGECFVEQFLDRPRHIEAQVIADTHGHVVVLGTRDCSLQRRNQKLVEEAPAPFLSDAQRARIHQSARDICARAGYVSAGTVEFLLSPLGHDLVPRGQHAPAGRAPRDRGNLGHRPGGGATARGRRPAAVDHRHAGAARPCLRVPHQRRRRGPRLPADARPGARVRAALGPRRARRHRRAVGLDGARHLRLADGQAHRHRRHARPGHRPRPPRAEGVPHRRRGLGAAVSSRGDGRRRISPSADAFKVHTRWIETDFANTLAAAVRSEPPVSDAALVRTAIEIDGRRMALGLPAELLRGLQSAAGGACSRRPQRQPPVAADPAAVAAPIAGTLQSWKVADGDTVAQGDIIATMEAMKMEMQVHGPPRRAHRAEGGAGGATWRRGRRLR